MKSSWFVLIAGCAVIPAAASCSSSPPASGGSVSEPTASAGAALSPAMEFVKLNGDADAKLHLLARQFVNNDTEVLSFYEPTPGNIIAVGAGHPTATTTLHPSHDVAALWNSLQPEEGMPQPLLDAIARQAAGVGIENFATHPGNAPDSVASFSSMTTAALATSEALPAAHAATPTTGEGTPTQAGQELVGTTSSAVVGSGYCDAQWPSAFPSNMAGSNTSFCSLAGSTVSSPGSWTAPFGSCQSGHCSTVEPYGSSCTCSCRTTVGFQQIHYNPAGSNGSNEWENFASACPPRGAATFKVTASNWNQSWTVNEDNYIWIQDVGTVTCFLTSCTSTNDIGTFDVSVNSQVSGGLINYIVDAYGP